MRLKTLRPHLAALAAAALLAACGGSDDPITYSNLVTFGDSLSDVGTYNVGTVAALGAQTGGAGRWTVNTTAGGQMWIERVAAELAQPKPCAAETGFQPNLPGITGAPVTARPGCFDYAQGSARVSSPVGPSSLALQDLGVKTLGLMAKPITKQMEAHLAAAGGKYSGKELVVVMAGANDVFMELELTAPKDQANAVGNVAAAGTQLGELIKSQVLGKGATRVLVMNVPNIARTPFGTAQTADVQKLIDTLVTTFNGKLAESLKGVGGVLMVDAYAALTDQVRNPAYYGISNASDVACGPNMLSNPPASNGSALVCNASNLLAGDRGKYLFADHVHPTPLGHELMAELALEALADAGWR